jgi:hypothetical protein
VVFTCFDTPPGDCFDGHFFVGGGPVEIGFVEDFGVEYVGGENTVMVLLCHFLQSVSVLVLEVN